MAVRKGSSGASGVQGQGSIEEASGYAVQCGDWTAPDLGSAGGLFFRLSVGPALIGERRAVSDLGYRGQSKRCDKAHLSRNERLTPAVIDAQHPA